MTRSAAAATARLASLIPRDADAVVEVRGDKATAAETFRRWNPWCRFDTGPAERLSGLAMAGIRADCVACDGSLLDQPSPLETIRQARRLLTPRGALLMILPEPTPQRLDRLATLCREAGLAVDMGEMVADEAGTSTHAVVRAAAPGLPRLLVQGMALRPSGAVTDKRMTEPAAFLRTIPGVAAVTEIDAATPRDFPGERIIVAQRRGLGREDVADLRRTAQRGYLMVGEIDDHPDYLDAIAGRGHVGLRGMHALQTSTPALAAELRAHADEIAVFPNQMAELPAARPAAAGGGPVRIFFGAFNRGADWAPLMPALDRIIARHGDRLSFAVVHDHDFFERLATSAKHFAPTCGYDEYLGRLGCCDIALLPLADTPFNRAKSDVKFIESAACGAVALASPTVYGASLVDGETGLLFHDPEEFERRLDHLIATPASRAAIAARARLWVFEHRLMARHFRARYDWYLSLAARKAALTSALLQRLDLFSPDPPP